MFIKHHFLFLLYLWLGYISQNPFWFSVDMWLTSHQMNVGERDYETCRSGHSNLTRGPPRSVSLLIFQPCAKKSVEILKCLGASGATGQKEVWSLISCTESSLGSTPSHLQWFELWHEWKIILYWISSLRHRDCLIEQLTLTNWYTIFMLTTTKYMNFRLVLILLFVYQVIDNWQWLPKWEDNFLSLLVIYFSCNKYLLSTYCAPGTLGSTFAMMNKHRSRPHS